jgi:ABC-type Na+ efflux pump permease subunit
MAEEHAGRPAPITALSILLFLFGLFAFVGSAFMWGEGFILQFPEGVNYGFPVTDILVNASASIVAATGLWRLKRYGYLASYFVAGFYVYASVYIFVEVIQTGPPYPMEIVAPQALAVLVAIGLIVYPERFRERFH